MNDNSIFIFKIKRCPMKKKTLLTAKEAAEKYGKVSAATIRRYARNHLLPYIQIQGGKRMLFELSDLENFFTPVTYHV